MLIKSLELENFKAFGNRVVIPMAPITLLFGENSAGKSSVLQSLNLLKQTRESRERGVLLLPRSEQGITDLGGFQDLIYDHDLSKMLKIRLQATPVRSAAEGYALEWAFERSQEEITLNSIDLHLGEKLHVARLGLVSDRRRLPPSLRRRLIFENQRNRRLGTRFAKFTWVTDDPIFWKPAFSYLRENRERLYEQFHERTKKQVLGPKFYEREDLTEDRRRDDTEQQINYFLSFFSREFTLEEFIDTMRKMQEEVYVGLDGFLPVSSVPSRIHQLIYEINRPIRLSYELADSLPNLGGLVMQASRAVEEALDALFPLGPYRRPPERWYIFTGTIPENVGNKGDLLPDLLFRRPDLLMETNTWLERLDIGYQLLVRSLGQELSDLFGVRLVDTRRDTEVEVSLSDVGFGISQILPFVVQSLASQGQIITIEQPEVHVHPKLQAELGELMADSIKEPRKNQFIVETHSEHLVLRLQKLIRNAALSPEDVSIVFVSRGKAGAELTRLRLDREGDFIDEWPGGFFPERLRELLD